MATGGLYGQSSAGIISPQSGSESSGLYGNNTVFGGTYFEWFIFKESASQPATPTGGSWSFVTNTGTAPSGWTLQPPSAPVNQVWVSIALVNSKTTASLTWSTPGLFGIVPNFTFPTPITGAAGTDASVVNLGTASNPSLQFTIPRGDTGAKGDAATIAAGSTTTTDPGTSASVTNVGTSSAAVFDFSIPRGAGVNSGGSAGQFLTKASGTDYDTTWTTITGTLNYQGAWNASTNTPTLTSSVGTNGYYYVVNVAGTTNLNGITDWQVGDWAIFNGSIWQKLDQTDVVTSVNGQTGVVSITASDLGALTDVTSTDGSVSITSPTSTTRDLSVAVSSSTYNVLVQVRNTTGSTLTKGTVVYISGATGQLPTVSKAIATSDATSAQTLGMISADLNNNTNGYVTVIGLISNVNTSAYSDGAQLYLSGTTAGAVTTTKPSAPTHLVYVGVVEHSHPTQGKIFVKVQNGYELNEIHDVSAQTPTDGQTIVYNSTSSLWESSNSPVISGTTVNNTSIGATTASTGAFTTLTASSDSSFTSTGAVQLSKGTTAERPAGTAGKLRFNTTTAEFEGYNGTAWASVGGSAISNDISTSTNLYPLFAAAITGTASSVYTSNAQYLFKPSTGELSVKAPIAANGVVINSDQMTSNYTIATGTNGFSVGPLTIASGVTLTVASGQRYVVI